MPYNRTTPDDLRDDLRIEGAGLTKITARCYFQPSRCRAREEDGMADVEMLNALHPRWAGERRYEVTAPAPAAPRAAP